MSNELQFAFPHRFDKLKFVGQLFISQKTRQLHGGITGDLPSAIASLQRALKLKPEMFEARKAMAQALMADDDPGKAFAEFREVVRLNPDFIEGYNDLGLALLGKRAPDEAIAVFHKALSLEPNHTNIRRHPGIALMQKTDFAAAFKNYQDLIQLAPGDAVAYYNLAPALKQQDELDEAVIALKKPSNYGPQACRNFIIRSA